MDLSEKSLCEVANAWLQKHSFYKQVTMNDALDYVRRPTNLPSCLATRLPTYEPTHISATTLYQHTYLATPSTSNTQPRTDLPPYHPD